MTKIKRIPCSNPECGKGQNAVAGEVKAEGGPYKFKACPVCGGYGYLEQRVEE